MTRERVKEMLPLLQAYVDGKTIQWHDYRDETWKDTEIPSFEYAACEYRIKSDSEYVPFKNAEECVAEMQRHNQFGWIKRKNEQHYYSIIEIMDNQLLLVGTGKFTKCVCDFRFDFREAFNQFMFLDDTPFGKMEEK